MTDVDISKKHERLSRQMSQLFIFWDIFKTVKKNKLSGSIFLVLPGFFCHCLLRRLQLWGKNNHDIFLPLYLNPVSNSYFSSFISFCCKAPINSTLLVKLASYIFFKNKISEILYFLGYISR